MERKELGPELKHVFVPFECKDLKDTGELKGYGAAFNNIDHGKDMIVPGAFKKSLDAHMRAKTMPAFLYSHDVKEPVGDWFRMGEDSTGLDTEGKIWVGDGIPRAQQAYRLSKSTGPKGLSIGYVTKKSDFNSKTGVRSLTEIDLHEVSIVTFPMNEKAIITGVKSLFKDAEGKFRSIRELESLLRDGGLSAQEAKAFLSKGASALGLRDAEEDELTKSLKEIIESLSN
jgi:HK97 family phage prohead protease